MKRTSLSRKAPLKRSLKIATKGRGKTRRPKSPGRGPARDGKYLAAVRLLPCVIDNRLCAYGVTVAHHAGRRPGVGMKCSDYETLPFCQWHHDCWHAGVGVFRGWDRARRLAWADEQIAFTQAALNHLIKAQP